MNNSEKLNRGSVESVSIVVATYNSRAFVEETLESVYNQTYQNLALVISDDCSTDDTVEVVKKWIEEERVKNRFQSIELITVPKNTGVSANCNRCLAAVPSDWFKFIAADDILFPNCIEDNMVFVQNNPVARIIFSQVRLYQDIFLEEKYIKTTPDAYPNNLMHPSLSALDQYHLLLVCDRINYTPSFFSNKDTLLSVGGYDESDRLVEDYPMWLKLTRAGVKLYYFHKETVGYRIHSKATNNKGDEVLIKPSIINTHLIRKRHAHPYLPKLMVLEENWNYAMVVALKKIGITKKTKFTEMLYRISTLYANPFFYLNAIGRRIKFN